MNAYLDANVLIASLVDERFTANARAFLNTTRDRLITSNFALAECVSALGRLARVRSLKSSEIQAALSLLDTWVPAKMTTIELEPHDVQAANIILRDFALGLRTPDAIHIAVAQRLGAELATFDERMAKAAKALRLPVVKI